MNNWTVYAVSLHMHTDHFPDKNTDQTTLEMRAAILKSNRRKSSVHTMFESCANTLTKIRAIIQQLSVSGEKPCEEQRENSALFLQQF